MAVELTLQYHHLFCSDQEAKTQLSMVLMLGSLGNLFFLRCLGRVMGDLSDLQTVRGVAGGVCRGRVC